MSRTDWKRKALLAPIAKSYAEMRAELSGSPPRRRGAIGYEELRKFNPYHGPDGRFSSANGAASFTYKPGQGAAYDRAIEREKQRTAALEAAKKPAFKPASTKKEAIAYAQKELGFQKVSYGTKLDIDTINHINEQITEIQAKYPEVKGAVQELKTTTSQRVYAQIRWYANGKLNFEVGSTLYGAGMQHIEKGYDRDVSSGFHPAGTTASSIVWHEYGHVLAAVATKKGLGVNPGDMIPDAAGQLKFASSQRSNAVETSWLRDAASSMGKGAGDIAGAISRYATKNAGETFAEAFAEVNGSASPRAEAIAVVKASGYYRT